MYTCNRMTGSLNVRLIKQCTHFILTKKTNKMLPLRGEKLNYKSVAKEISNHNRTRLKTRTKWIVFKI